MRFIIPTYHFGPWCEFSGEGRLFDQLGLFEGRCNVSDLPDKSVYDCASLMEKGCIRLKYKDITVILNMTQHIPLSRLHLLMSGV